jgi:hypothetical protein
MLGCPPAQELSEGRSLCCARWQVPLADEDEDQILHPREVGHVLRHHDAAVCAGERGDLIVGCAGEPHLGDVICRVFVVLADMLRRSGREQLVEEEPHAR